MFYIKYEIISTSFDNIEAITEEEIQYSFLLGNVIFSSENKIINMEWEWIPLLDFSYSLFKITESLTSKERVSENFEFTESNETLEFFKNGNYLKITPSFSSDFIESTFNEFVVEVKNFYEIITNYIKNKAEDKVISEALNKYIMINK